ncbi:PKD domain-containing protein [Chitinophaga rhizophila]|uniref:T9SS type A sorting domain-containing protein n=1 Tax=Chitinophaga rhizophila TaxID=2866212 RepID=A0ABS7GAF7_9BACT|nr:PKD domain-containing protein [Chitinophaga rhizophila]MBW8684648.1 T9SS type A sorting domain-containing protein [Chitinophaga rhizophila]
MMKTLLFLTLFLGLVFGTEANSRPPARWSVKAYALLVNCGNSALLGAKVSSPERKYTVHWSTGQRSPVIKVARSGRYIVTVKDVKGIIRGRDTIQLVLKRPFESKISVRRSATADSLVAFPQNTRLTRYTYRWYRNDSLIRKGNSPYLVKPADGIYKVEVISITGCRDFSDTVNYRKILAPLTIDFSYNVVDCSEQTISFSAQVDSAETVASYAWDFGDQNSADIPNPVHGYAAGTYTVTLTVTTVSGRIGVVSKQLLIPPVTQWEVSIIQRPNACGDGVQLTAVAPPEARYFEWNGLPDLRTITVRTSGRYLLHVYDSCTNLRGTAYTDVVVTEAYQAEVRLIPGGDGPDTLVAAFQGGAAFPAHGIPTTDYIFTWYRNGVAGGVGEPWITDPETGAYQVMIETRSGCASLAYPYYYERPARLQPAKVAERHSRDTIAGGKVAIKVFPNPTAGQLYLQFDKPLSRSVNIQVFDMQGNVHYTRTTVQQLQLLDLSFLPKGQYMVSVTGIGEKMVQTVIIQ